jgi:hypothetical protein
MHREIFPFLFCFLLSLFSFQQARWRDMMRRAAGCGSSMAWELIALIN